MTALTAPNAETRGLGEALDTADPDDLAAIGATAKTLQEHWGVRYRRRMELLVALYLDRRLAHHTEARADA